MSDPMPPSTLPTRSSPAASLRERSTSDLIRAIHGPTSTDSRQKNEAAIRDRARTVLKIGFQPEESDEERVKLIEEFVKALHDLPEWAVMRGFDDWIRTRPRRPTPAEVRILAKDALTPFTDELARRKRIQEEIEEARRAGERPPPDPERVQAILREHGFTAERKTLLDAVPAATSVEEARNRNVPRDTYADRLRAEQLTPDSDAAKALAAARDANPHVQAARATARAARE